MLLQARQAPVRVAANIVSLAFACDLCLPRLMLPNVRIPFAKPLLVALLHVCISPVTDRKRLYLQLLPINIPSLRLISTLS